ncbi:hypothetical protein ABBQ38_005148 [Trebouxia sp. C0009 RCD-2024]
MQLTPLSRLQAWPQPSGVATMPPAPSLPRLNKPAAVLAPSAPDSTCDIHRLLESYSRQITQTEGQISCICQTQQQVVQEHQKDLAALGQAKREAQIADEEAVVLAAQVYQMQMEVSAKQANCSRIKGELAALTETCKVASAAMSADKRHFILQCQHLDAELRSAVPH